MRYFFIVGIFLLLILGCGKRELPQLNDGTETVVEQSVYVVHSMIYADSLPWTTSNIYIIKGTGDTVWIYGSGYGDFADMCSDCNDNNYYLGAKFYGTGPAIADVNQVDSVITKIFDLHRDSVLLQFIVPHYHNDHINNEFIDAFHNKLNYPLRSDEKIWIHTNDAYGAICNEPCCGTEPCPDKKNKFYGVPFHPAWQKEYINLFTKMGVTNDACNAVIKTFTSSSGEWQITKALAVENGGHTDGTVNLHNNSLQLRIAGTKSKKQCPLPEGWRLISVHGNVNGEDNSPGE